MAEALTTLINERSSFEWQNKVLCCYSLIVAKAKSAHKKRTTKFCFQEESFFFAMQRGGKDNTTPPHRGTQRTPTPPATTKKKKKRKSAPNKTKALFTDGGTIASTQTSPAKQVSASDKNVKALSLRAIPLSEKPEERDRRKGLVYLTITTMQKFGFVLGDPVLLISADAAAAVYDKLELLRFNSNYGKFNFVMVPLMQMTYTSIVYKWWVLLGWEPV